MSLFGQISGGSSLFVSCHAMADLHLSTARLAIALSQSVLNLKPDKIDKPNKPDKQDKPDKPDKPAKPKLQINIDALDGINQINHRRLSRYTR